MDNHPIPQDVTNFQFKLVGDLSLKQVGYLIVSVVLAWISIILPLFFFIKAFLALSFIGIGVILAFVPFEGRPADQMFLHFFKALFVPNIFTYQNQKTADTTHVVKEDIKEAKKEEKKDDKTTFFQSIPHTTPLTNQQPDSTGPRPVVLPTQQATPQQTTAQQASQKANDATVIAQEETLEKQLNEAKQEEAHVQEGTNAAKMAHEKVQQLETQLHDVFLQKQDLEHQLLSLKQQLMEKQQQAVFTPSVAQAPQETSHVKKVPKQLSTSIGIPVTSDVPNLLAGIVKDPRGNILPNILVEVKDKDGNAVRAFKTNNLGQFISATPLLSGVYTISFEDPAGKQQFDSVEITATGDILLPIEVISSDQREKLRQELFG
ncbi:MAG TPA: PrgI family protein [Patescibacteria group bacterium]|nr:PrgI family protein [Patescibacteria group bacterium]